ncbi:MAG TPA: hypothetical protein VLD17_01410 [Gemmatimonadaceae bacterium]|nr:hypothetical protein [Gemmatimonadaceae bacterium]
MKVIVLVLAATAVACSSSTGPQTPSFDGTWSLVSVNGAALPDTFGPIAGIDAVFLIDHATLFIPENGTTGTFTTDFRISVDTTELPNVDTVTVLDNGTELEWVNLNDITEPMSVHRDTLTLTTSRWNPTPQTYRFARSGP